MQIKDEGNDNNKGGNQDRGHLPAGLDQLTHSNLNSNRGGGIGTGRDLNETGLSSTFKSIDLPPKEYEQQLQQYEAEVRNHIKVEQQLKLHIEVLNEKIEEFDKEKEEIRQQLAQEFKDNERKLKEKLKGILDQKQSEIARINKELQIAQAQVKQSNNQLNLVMNELQSQQIDGDQQIQFGKFHPQIQQQNK